MTKNSVAAPAWKHVLVGLLSLSLALGPAPAALAEDAFEQEEPLEAVALEEEVDEESVSEDAAEPTDLLQGSDASSEDQENLGDPDGEGEPSDPVSQPTDISAATLTLSANSFVYDGTAKCPDVEVTLDVPVAAEDDDPEILTSGDSDDPVNPDDPTSVTTITLVQGDDYTLSYANNVNAGTATVTATGMGQYEGSVSATFAITRCSISNATILGVANVKYNGKAQTQPKMVVKVGGRTLRINTDYTVAYANNKNTGKATVTIAGINNYKDKVSRTFSITGTSIAKAQVSGIVARTYTGKAQGQKPTVKLGKKTLKLNTDYKLSYKNNVNAGTATMTIKGCGAYEGSTSRTFKINKADFSKAKLSSIGKQAYTGKAITPATTVKWNGKTLKRGTDYTVSYKNNKKAGKATVTVTGKGNFSGAKKSVKFTIYKRNAKDFKVSSIARQDYNYGKAITPSPTVKWGSTVLKRGTDYTLSYKNNKYGGKATVVITGKGAYTGSKSVSFSIYGPKYYGKTVYITDTGSKYHRGSCRYLYSKHACDKGEAIWEGYEACKVCKP